MTWHTPGEPAPAAVAAAAPEARNTFSQTTSFDSFAGLALLNSLLGLLTLTLYRFWARAAQRKRIWGQTWLMGDPLEYGGTGMELFRGFLIAAPVLFVPFIGVFYIAPVLLPPETVGLLFLVAYPILIVLFGVGLFLMRRYQLSRTRWRGVRFSLRGSAFSFGVSSFGWTILEVLTLFWYHPAARMRRARRLWRDARFGDVPFRFADGEPQLAKGLYGPFALGWFGTLIGVPVVFFALNLLLSPFIVALTDAAGAWSPEDGTLPPLWLIALWIAQLTSLLVLYLAVWTPFQAEAMKRVAALLELDGARFELDVNALGLLSVQLYGLFMTLISLGLLAPLASAARVRYVFSNLTMISTPRLAEIYDGGAGPRTGEGIADAFDLDFGAGAL